MSSSANHRASDDRGEDPVTEESRARKFMATLSDPFNPQASGVTLPGLGRPTRVTWSAFQNAYKPPDNTTRILMLWDPLGDYRSSPKSGPQSRVYLFALDANNGMLAFTAGTGPGTLDLTPFQSPQSTMLTYGLRVKDVTPLLNRGGTKTVGAAAACINSMSVTTSVSQSLVRQRDVTNGVAVASDQHIEMHHFSEDLPSQIVIKSDAQRGSTTFNLSALPQFTVVPAGNTTTASGTGNWSGTGVVNAGWNPVLCVDFTQAGNATTGAPYRVAPNVFNGAQIDPDSPLMFGFSYDIELPLYGNTALGATTAGVLNHVWVCTTMQGGGTNTYFTGGLTENASQFTSNSTGRRPTAIGDRTSAMNVTTGDHFMRLVGSVDAKEVGAGFLSSATLFISFSSASVTYFNTPTGTITSRAYRQSRGDSIIIGELVGAASGATQPTFNIEAAVTTNTLCGPSLNALLTSAVELTASRAELNVSTSSPSVITVASAK